MATARPQAVPLGRAGSSRRRYLTLSLSLVFLLAVLFTARTFLVPSAESPVGGGVYREAVVGQLPQLDPFVARLSPQDPDLTPLLYRGLVAVDEHGQARPDLAERWEVSGEGRVYRFTLRPSLHWDDGTPLTTADVLFTVERAALLEASGRTGAFWSALEVRALRSNVVEFVLREPLGAFVEHAALPIVAAHAPPSSLTVAAASSGPYHLVEGEPGTITLERNPEYGGPAGRFERVELRLLASREAAVQALLDGQIDALAGLTPAERGVVSGAPGLVVHAVPEYDKHGLLVLNAQAGPLRERSVRQAIAQAIDRETLVESTLAGQGETAYSPISPLSWAFDPNLRPRLYAPSAAREALAEAGWRAERGGPLLRGGQVLELTLVTTDSPPRVRESNEIARQLGLIGVQVMVRPVPADQLVERYLAQGNFDAALIGRWLPETDPDQFALWHSTQARGSGDNYGGISSPDLDRWLELGRRQVSLEARTAAYRHFQAVWADEQPGVLLYYPHAAYAIRREVHGVAGGPLPDASWRLRGLPRWYREAAPAPGNWWPFGRS